MEAITMKNNRQIIDSGQSQFWESIPEGVAICNFEGNMVYASRKTHEILGFEHDESLVGKSIFKFIDADGHKKFKSFLLKVVQGIQSLSVQVFLCPKNKSRVHAEFYANLYENQDQTLGIIITIRNIGFRKRIENELYKKIIVLEKEIGIKEKTLEKLEKSKLNREDLFDEKALVSNESENLFKNLVEQASDGVALAGRNGEIAFWNLAMEGITGITSSEAIGNPLWEIIAGMIPADEESDLSDMVFQEAYGSAFEKTSADWINKLSERQITNAKGNQKTVQSIMFPVEVNSQIHLGAIFRDITEQAQVKAELQKARKKAEESNQLKSAFLANLSHEVRTPLNGILGFTQLLLSSENDLDLKSKYAEQINCSSNQLLNLMNDILDLSRINSGEYIVVEKEIDLGNKLDDLVSGYENMAMEKNLDLEIKKDLPAERFNIKTDGYLLQGLLSKLVDNAIKFTNLGQVELGCSLEPGQDVVQFYVKDTGIGIPKHQQGLVFEKFRQLELSMSRKYGGNGIGLSIAKAYTEKLGGKIWLESAVGQGSTFYVSLPFTTGTKKTRASKLSAIGFEKQEGKSIKKSILVVDDLKMNVLLIKEMLKKNGIVCHEANNGKEAVDFIANGNHADMILMDIKMPTMNGIDATKKIKALNENIPIIAQSAYIIAKSKGELKGLGFEDYIEKPINRDKLRCLVEKYLHISVIN